jgi:hypothetical protein
LNKGLNLKRCRNETHCILGTYWREGKDVDRIQKALAMIKRVESGESVEFPISIMAKVKAEFENWPNMDAEAGIAAVWCECKLLAKSPVGPLFDAKDGNG